jgi:NADH:ubiquinone oxidoreductase subunit F (NADH-binding)
VTASLTRIRVQRWPGLSSGLLADAALDRESAADYLGSGGYREVADLPGRLAASGLRGRGGAAFPVARKLDAVLARHGPRVVVANGEEGEPASIKDRYLLLHRPHLVLDGLRLMARAAAADRAYVYVSDPAVGHSVVAALAEVAAGWDIPVSVFTVDHTYVAGEESALVRAIDGGPALPTAKPPRAYESGVGGAPTLVQNVETLAHVALIAADRGSGDTFLATLTGAGHPPALLELPFGVRLGDVVGDVSGLRGATVGGLFGGVLADPWRVPLRYDDVRALGSGLGCCAFGLLGIDDCPVDAAADAVAYLAAESARQCGVCINATAGMREVLAGLRVGTTTADDVIRLAGWTQRVPGRGACALLDAAARMAASLLREFPAEVEAHLAGPCSRCADLGPLPRHTRNHLEIS